MLNRYGDKKIKRRRAPRFELSGGLVCLDFVNTLDDRPSGEPKELLASYIDLARFGEDTGILDPHQVDRLFGLSQAEPAAAKHALAAAIQLREVICEVFWAILNKKPAPAAALMTLNQYVQVAAEHSRLVEIGGHFEWRIETAPADFNAPLWPIARSAADLLASDQLEYVRACSSKTCQWLFLDTSKNHGRRWCDMKLCGNRAKFQRFYSRQKRSAFTTKDTKVHEGNR